MVAAFCTILFVVLSLFDGIAVNNVGSMRPTLLVDSSSDDVAVRIRFCAVKKPEHVVNDLSVYDVVVVVVPASVVIGAVGVMDE